MAPRIANARPSDATSSMAIITATGRPGPALWNCGSRTAAGQLPSRLLGAAGDGGEGADRGDSSHVNMYIHLHVIFQLLDRY